MRRIIRKKAEIATCNALEDILQSSDYPFEIIVVTGILVLPGCDVLAVDLVPLAREADGGGNGALRGADTEQ